MNSQPCILDQTNSDDEGNHWSRHNHNDFMLVNDWLDSMGLLKLAWPSR